MTLKLKTPDDPVLPHDGCALSVCEACEASFACGASQANCWCGDVELDESARAELRALYRRCLCPACLKIYAARGRGEVAADGAADARAKPMRVSLT